ncbi:hypothetical protein CU098_007908, partial [Rhizopus stolonifer]
TTASIVTAYLFPVCALITSIPVFTIVIRDNLLRGDVCSKPMAVFLSNFLPWLICIPLQTKDYINTIQNWSSLFFQSTVNFILPFILYFVSRKYEASVEPMAAPEPEYDVKSPIPIMSPSIKHPDDNDVRMYDPDDHCSASIRRSSIKNSRISQMEGSVIVYSPNMDVPTIVYSDLAAQDPPNENPPMYTPNGGLKPQRHSTNSSTTAHSPNGLGISQPGELKPEQNLMVPRSPEISQVAPRSPSIRSYHSPRLTASIKSSAIAP